MLYEYAKNVFHNLNQIVKTINQPKEETHIYIGATTTNFLEPILPDLKEFKKNILKLKYILTWKKLTF